MLRRRYYNLALRVVVLTLAFCLTARPLLNAAGPESSARGPRTHAENLFRYASDMSGVLHERPSDERSLSEYRRVLDAYSQVTRLNTDSHFSAEALMRMAELQREMADTANDSHLYAQTIATFRRITTEHPQSAFVGDALVGIAQVYEENLQDLDGAARAYRELIDQFPTSVMAREGRAVLARFNAQLRNRPVDVVVPDRSESVSAFDPARPRLNNVRNFSGRDYARVVIDLSNQADYSGGREGDRRLNVHLAGTSVSSALYGRRFIVGDSSLLRRIMVRENGGLSGGIDVGIEVGSAADYSMFRLSEPERIIIDIRPSVLAASGGRIEIDKHDASGGTEEVSEAQPSASDLDKRLMRKNSGERSPARPIFGLPEITEPILPHNPSESRDSTSPASAGPESKVASDAPIKCIVIDPGHGGHDTGTISGNGLREKDLVLDIARRLQAYIKGKYPAIEVVMTRESDRFIALEERTAIANSRHADLFISVHANASPARAASGVETFFVTPDRAKEAPEPGKTVAELTTPAEEKTAGTSEPDRPEPIVASVRVGNRVAESRELARYIQAGLVRGIGAASPRTAANRGVKHAAFAVLVGAAMPSVLAEVSFISNPRDEALLQTTEFRERIAASLFAGLSGYLKKNRPGPGKS